MSDDKKKEKPPLRPISPAQREMLEEATSEYENNVSQEVSDYLDARGLDFGVRLNARLGVVTQTPYPGHERFKGWLAIPYLDHRGRPLTIRFRCLKDHDHENPWGKVDENGKPKGRHGKYMSMYQDPARVYNVGAIHRAEESGKPIEIAEGEPDALLLESLGLHAIALPGVQTWLSHAPNMLAGINRIRVWADPDDAGAELTAKILHSMWNARSIRLTEGDVGETWKAGGAEALLGLIR